MSRCAASLESWLKFILSDDFCNWSTILIIVVGIIWFLFRCQVRTSPRRLSFGSFEDCDEFFFNYLQLNLSHLMNLLLVIETKQCSYDYYMTQCCNEISQYVFFARICNSWRMILIWIHLSHYLSKQSDDHLSWRQTRDDAFGGWSPLMHGISSILRTGLRVVAIDFSTSSVFGEYWISYVTIDCEHAWRWTSRKDSKRSSYDASIWKPFVSELAWWVP